ncbi:amidohydrolase family protein [Maribacter confluentis]|uniref:Amidohydrolase family protein n=1 Tax=Maribacter confluentis TaxID=1656093 RepID=A0ABT8RLB1_9FLAO|nr:amidohydrolase family protein [Maribacter confluentis]MDO1511560.1 amidohydrolase family protein [Maribacter confluentis]
MVIDSHQHFWIYHPEHHEWISDDMSIIQTDFLPHDLEPILKENGVDGCIAVQTAQTEEETEFLLHLANQYDCIKGVVGWVDLRNEQVAERLSKYKEDPYFKGVRWILQAENDSFFYDTAFRKGLAELAKFNLTYDLLVYHNQLPHVLDLVHSFPDNKFVLDHIGKPAIKEEGLVNWSNDIKKLAAFPNVYVKLSGMVTEADWTNWTEEEIIPFIDVVFNVFGAERIMFGSDWPVCLLASDYRKVKTLVDNYLKKLSDKERALVLGGTACGFYSIGS